MLLFKIQFTLKKKKNPWPRQKKPKSQIIYTHISKYQVSPILKGLWGTILNWSLILRILVGWFRKVMAQRQYVPLCVQSSLGTSHWLEVWKTASCSKTTFSKMTTSAEENLKEYVILFSFCINFGFRKLQCYCFFLLCYLYQSMRLINFLDW